jgi:2-amino-4-hydroxy-6-hydroxymethyldihydropteridine diphosphokinase
VPAVNQVALALGSNLGDRVANLQGALDALIVSDILSEVEASSIYETEPVGGPDQGRYLNAVLKGFTQLLPEALLAAIHNIEDELGRVRSVRWGPRTVDIDILAYGQEVWDTEELVIPHPRAHERAFVLLPWSEIDADFEIAGHGTVKKCLAVVSLEGVEHYADTQLSVKDDSTR